MAVILLGTTAMAQEAAYRAALEKWRAQREAELKADGGWLTVTGLEWLKDGENRIAGVPGVFALTGKKATFRADRGAVVTSAGKPVTSIEMTPTTAIDAGGLTLTVIERGGRHAVRVKDKQSKYRKAFHGLKFFPVRDQYRVTARWVAYPKPKQIPIVNIIGALNDMPSPGYAVFSIAGRELRLDPVVENDKELFFIFRDQTSGKETYPGGRFLYTGLPKDGKLEIDFNKSENPPCAFTPYATCPLPPKQNSLPVRIEAGELTAHQ